MKLTDFENKPTAVVAKALKENYNMPFEVEKLNRIATQNMLKKVRALISETKSSADFYSSQNNPTYLKLMFMEQALENHYSTLNTYSPKIVVENEEVEKSQVVLAAQDMVDTVQKMVEQVSDMLVKELPALVDSVQSEIGVNESTAFNSQATEALTTLQTALTSTKSGLQNALNGITGVGGTPETFDASMMGPESGEEVDISATEELPPEPEAAEAPEEEPVGGVGRAKR